MADPIITKIEIHTYESERVNLGKDYNGFNLVYEPGSRIKSQGSILRIETDQGIVGEYAGGGGAEYSTLPTFAHFL
ncbi:MAG: mandelate racemase, partial [Caldilineaceae bacterium SB0670_bin_27]|nr:mandelate racemase [Caldilineaceae bacterium SB0670_bin_27]